MINKPVVCRWILVFAIPFMAKANELYDVVHLGTLGGSESRATALNDSGYITGWSHDTSGMARAFIWTTGSMTGLSFPSGSVSQVGEDINNSNVVVGTAFFGARSEAVMWTAGSISNLATISGSSYWARALNDLNHAVGDGYSTNGGIHGAYWDEDGFIDFGPYNSYGSLFNHTSCRSYGINNQGYAVGITHLFTGKGDSWRPFIWCDKNNNNLYDDYVFEMIILGTLGGDYGQAFDVNEFGDVTGHAWTLNNAAAHIFLVEPVDGTWKIPSTFNNITNLLMRDLGCLPGHDFANGNAINDAGVIVGFSEITLDGASRRAVIYDQQTLQDLNDLIHTNSGWVLREAADINHSGQIVGWGTYQTETNAFLLNPAQTSVQFVQVGVPDTNHPGRARIIWDGRGRSLRYTLQYRDQLKGPGLWQNMEPPGRWPQTDAWWEGSISNVGPSAVFRVHAITNQ